MTTIKVSELPVLNTGTGTQQVVINADGDATSLISVDDLSTYIAGLLIDTAPEALDTLNELAAALGDDPDFAATMTTLLAGKLSLSGGVMTGDLDMNGNSILNGATSFNLLREPQVRTSSHATFALHASTNRVEVIVVGAGGAGGGANSTSTAHASSAAGGNGGQIITQWVDVSALDPKQVAITIGAGGVGTTGAGGDGGDTSFSDGTVTITAEGGNGADAGPSNQTPTATYNAAQTGNVGGDINTMGTNGGVGFHFGDGVDAKHIAVSGVGGSTPYGAGGAPVAISDSTNGAVAGSNGVGYGSGGSGAVSIHNGASVSGGDGADGLVIIKEYA